VGGGGAGRPSRALPAHWIRRALPTHRLGQAFLSGRRRVLQGGCLGHEKPSGSVRLGLHRTARRPPGAGAILLIDSADGGNVPGGEAAAILRHAIATFPRFDTCGVRAPLAVPSPTRLFGAGGTVMSDLPGS